MPQSESTQNGKAEKQPSNPDGKEDTHSDGDLIIVQGKEGGGGMF